MTDYLGDVLSAMRRYEDFGPGVAQIDINSSDQHRGRYGVVVWNGYGKWSASEETLAESINRAVDRGIIDQFGFGDAKWSELVGRADFRCALRAAGAKETR